MNEGGAGGFKAERLPSLRGAPLRGAHSSPPSHGYARVESDDKPVERPSQRKGDFAQTLDRGLQVLEMLALRSSGATITQIASDIGIGRTVARRLVNTLQSRRLIAGPFNGAYRLGSAIQEMSRHVEATLKAVADDFLLRLAGETGLTSHLSIREGDDVIALSSVASPNARNPEVWSAGSRHTIRLGAAGVALQSLREPTPFDSNQVQRCRTSGFSLSRAQIDEDTLGIAVPISAKGWHLDIALGVVGRQPVDEDALIPIVVRTGQQLTERLEN